MNAVKIRHERILKHLEINKFATVNDLSELLNISKVTVRRDLNSLSQSKKIIRTHGGAEYIHNEKNIEDYLYQKKKNALAKRAVDFIDDNDTIFINSSSTALLILKYLKDKRVTVITNNGKSLFMDIDNNVNVVISGGNVNFPKTALTGEFAINNLSNVTASKAIMGISGISKESGLTTKNLDEVHINKLMLDRATEEKIIVADSSKINHTDNFITGNISSITTLITDSDADINFINYLEKNGVQVILVPFNNF